MSKNLALQCPSCGASNAPNASTCDYCNNYLPNLTIWERRDSPENEGAKGNDYKYFHSLSKVYWTALMTGLVLMVGTYVFFLDELSEDELVAWSPIWFLLVIFGIGGFYGERAIKILLDGKAKDFTSGLIKASDSLGIFQRMFIMIVFLLPGLFGVYKKLSSPILITLSITLIWAAALYFFLFGIFPSM